jgi:hypothetical protein
MSTASETLERVAELLPPAQRERLLLIALKFRNIPEEDEFLQVLEGIGLMTLVWSRIPQEIHAILEAVKPTHPNADFLNAQIRSTIQASIPSFEDLRQVSQSLQQQQTALIRFQNSSPSSHASPTRSGWIFFAGMLAGLLAAILIEFSAKFYLP